MYTDYNEENEEESYYDDENNQNNQDNLKKMIIYIGIGIVALILILAMARGCTKKNNKKTETPIVALGMKNITLGVGETYLMQFDVLNAKASDPAITWKSGDETIIWAVGTSPEEPQTFYGDFEHPTYGKCRLLFSPSVKVLREIKTGLKPSLRNNVGELPPEEE